MTDSFSRHAAGLQSPASRLLAVTPSDTGNLAAASRALNVAASGNVRVTTVEGDIGTVFVAAGVAFPLRVSRVWQTGTTATGIVAML